MMRFALYSDIHGNLGALEAVYRDMDECGMAERYCLGDLVGYGSNPSEVIKLVRDRGDEVIRGNYDDGVGKGTGDCGCFYATPADKEAGAESYIRTFAALKDAERAYLAHLPGMIKFNAQGLQVLLTHGSPRRINEYLMPDRPERSLVGIAEPTGAGLICFGHVHVPYHRTAQLPNGRIVHFVSDGSVGKPKDGDPRACWTEVTIDQGDVDVKFHRVEHDGEVLA